MNKKKLLTLVLTLALIGAVGVGATLAYFTDTAEATNVVTMGHVDIELTETSIEGEGVVTGEVTEDGIAFDEIVPGDVVSKKAEITVQKGSQPCYVRVNLDVVSDNNQISKDKLDALKTAIITSASGWSLGEDGYLYYPTILKAEEAVTIFETVTIPPTWDNTVAGKSFEIKINAEAVQSDNNEDTDWSQFADEDKEADKYKPAQ